MFWSKNKKNRYTPVLLCKMGFKGVYITQTCYHDGTFYRIPEESTIRGESLQVEVGKIHVPADFEQHSTEFSRHPTGDDEQGLVGTNRESVDQGIPGFKQ